MSETLALAEQVLWLCRSRGAMVTTAESCTGGLAAAAITDLPGSSGALDRGFVTYSNRAKFEMLDVPKDVIDRFGAVSPETAAAMAAGALNRSCASVSVAITGIAGPDGGSAGKPVGLVWFGSASKHGPVRTMSRHFAGMSRQEVRMDAVAQALRLLIERLEQVQAGE